MFLLSRATQHLAIRKAAGALREGGRFLFTAPARPLVWNDSLTGLESISLGRDEYVHAIEETGLTLDGEYDDEGDNHYFSAVLTRGPNSA